MNRSPQFVFRPSLPLAGIGLAALLGLAALPSVFSQTTPAPEPVTLARLAARLSAVEAENRTLKERVDQMEKEPVTVPVSSLHQTTEGYAYYGMPLRSYPYPPVGPLRSSEVLPYLLSPNEAQPQSPPRRVPDSRQIPGLMLLKERGTGGKTVTGRATNGRRGASVVAGGLHPAAAPSRQKPMPRAMTPRVCGGKLKLLTLRFPCAERLYLDEPPGYYSPCNPRR